MRSLLGTEIVAVNPESGPPGIEGYYDEALSVPGVIAEVQKAEAVDAKVTACFDDTGLDSARSFSVSRVIGIGEVALLGPGRAPG